MYRCIFLTKCTHYKHWGKKRSFKLVICIYVQCKLNNKLETKEIWFLNCLKVSLFWGWTGKWRRKLQYKLNKTQANDFKNLTFRIPVGALSIRKKLPIIRKRATLSLLLLIWKPTWKERERKNKGGFSGKVKRAENWENYFVTQFSSSYVTTVLISSQPCASFI